MGRRPHNIEQTAKPDPDRGTWASRVSAIVILALAYLVAGKLGLRFTALGPYASAVWLPAGLALAGLLLCGRRAWPGVLLGAFLVNAPGRPLSLAELGVALGIAAGSTLAAVLGAYLVERWAHGVRAFERAQDVFSFAVLAGLVSTAVSATIGAATLSLAGLVPWSRVGAFWFVWWMAAAVADLLLAPPILLWARDGRLWWTRRRLLEAGLLTVGLGGLFLVVFTGVLPLARPDWALSFLTIPLLLWFALRFRQRDVANVMLLLSGIAFGGALHGLRSGGMTGAGVLLHTQEYLAVCSVMLLVVSAEVWRRRRHEWSLRLQARILQHYAESPAQANALRGILRIIAETADWEVGTMWVPDDQIQVLRSGEIWHRPFLADAEFLTQTAQLTFAQGSGLPGRVWASGAPVWIADAARQEGYLRARAATHGLHAHCAFPILADAKVVGVMELASRKVRHADEHLLATLQVLGSQIGQPLERRRAEAAWRASEEQLRFALAAARMYAWDWDFASRRLVQSENAGELWGRHDLQWGEIQPLLLPGDREAVRQAAARSFTERKPFETEYRVVRPDGQVRWLAARAQARYGADGKPEGLAGVSLDITERKRAEERFQLAVESAPSAMIVADRTGRIVLVNSQAEKLFGYQRRELIGQPMEILAPARFREAQQAARQDSRAGAAVRPAEAGQELYGLRQDGSEFPIEIGLSPFETDEGIFVLSAIVDITERRRAERERTELLAQVKALAAQRHLIEIVDLAADFVKMIDRDGRVLYLNRAGRKLVGIGEDEDVTPTWLRDYHPAWAMELIRAVALPEAERVGYWTGELAVRARNGREIPVSQTIVAHRDGQGRVQGYSTIARDITEHKRAERIMQELAGRLIGSQEDERQSIAGELHDHVSQELAFLAIALDEGNQPALADMAKEAAQEIRQLWQRLHSSTLDNLGLVPALENLAAEFSGRRGVDVSIRTSGIPAALPSSTALCLFRIAEEGLNNVVKHSGAHAARIALSGEGERILLVIEDEGVGFDPLAVERRPGLGFLTMRERLRLLEGNLHIRSSPSKGARIEASIPWRHASVAIGQ